MLPLDCTFLTQVPLLPLALVTPSFSCLFPERTVERTSCREIFPPRVLVALWSGCCDTALDHTTCALSPFQISWGPLRMLAWANSGGTVRWGTLPVPHSALLRQELSRLHCRHPEDFTSPQVVIEHLFLILSTSQETSSHWSVPQPETLWVGRHSVCHCMQYDGRTPRIRQFD